MSSKEYVAAKVTLVGKYDTNETLTFWLSNQIGLNEFPFTEQHFPLLESITNIGIEQNQFYPKNSSGTIRLLSGPNSLIFERRLIDLSSVFAIQGAAVTLYAYCAGLKAQEFYDEATAIWSGKVSGVAYTTRGIKDSQALSLTISREEKSHFVTKQLRESEFSELPERSVNKVLPLVFGTEQQVIPYALSPQVPQATPIVTPVGAYQDFAYATNLEGSGANRFRNTGITKYRIKTNKEVGNQDSDYEEIQSAPDALTAVYSTPSNTSVGNIVNLAKPRAFWLPGYFPGPVTSVSYAVTGIVLTLQGNSAGGNAEGELSIRLHKQRPNFNTPTPASDSLAEAVVDKADYATDWSGAAAFEVAAVFDKIVPITGSGTYWISIQGSNEDDAASETWVPVANIQFLPGVPAGLITNYKTTEAAGAENPDIWEPELIFGAGGQTSGIFEVFALEFEDTPAPGGFDEEGLGYSRLRIRYNEHGDFYPNGGKVIEDLDRLDLILEMTGLVDTDGNVTGVPGFILGNPLTQIEALYSIFNGTGWQLGNFDNTRFADSHAQYTDVSELYYRDTSGRTWGRTTNIEVIKDICRNSYSAITFDAFSATPKYSLYAPGRYRSPVAHINDSTASIERIHVNVVSNVVNALNMHYARRLDNIHFQLLHDASEAKDYSKTLLRNYRDGGVGQSLSAISYTHYGEQRRRDDDYDFIKTDRTADAVSKLILRLHEHPEEYVLLTTPYCNYPNLQMLDIITVTSTELPRITGNNPYLCGVNRSDSCWFTGTPWAKSGTYDAEIVALTINYSSRMGIQLRILCRLITLVNDPQSSARFNKPTTLP